MIRVFGELFCFHLANFLHEELNVPLVRQTLSVSSGLSNISPLSHPSGSAASLHGSGCHRNTVTSGPAMFQARCTPWY